MLIEHNMKVVLRLATHITVMDRGRVIADGDRRAWKRTRKSSAPISAGGDAACRFQSDGLGPGA